MAFSIESYGTAGVHARESHFPGIFTVKRLRGEGGKMKECQSEKGLDSKKTFPYGLMWMLSIQKLYSGQFIAVIPNQVLVTPGGTSTGAKGYMESLAQIVIIIKKIEQSRLL